jgi:DDE superfamily endonuclease
MASPKKQLKTPTKAAIRGAAYFCQLMKLPCTTEDLAGVFGTSKKTSQRVLQGSDSRTIGKGPERGPSVRHHPVDFTPNESQAVGDWLDQAEFDEKGLPWKDIAYEAGVNTSIHSRTIQRHLEHDQGIVTRSAPDKELLPERIQDERKGWAKHWLIKKDWTDAVFSDELHWGTGPRKTSKIKRRVGQRYKKSNIQFQKNVRKAKGVTRDLGPFSNFHTFCVVGFDFKWMGHYNCGNSNGKMNSATYIEILKDLTPILRARGLKLVQDNNSAHVSKQVIKWQQENGCEVLNLPSKSPDLSVMETWAGALRTHFFERKTVSEKAGKARAESCFWNLDQAKINQNILSYRARLHSCKEFGGAMTKY